MESLRPPVPVSVPATAAGTQSGVSDVVLGQTSDTAIDQKPDARLGLPPAPGAIATGEGEQKASVQSNGQPQPAPAPKAAAAPASPLTTTTVDATLPTNHPMTKDQIKMMKKAQDKQAKAQKKQQPKTGTQPAAAAATAQPAATQNLPTPVPAQ
jgi:hypothetical protein